MAQQVYKVIWHLPVIDPTTDNSTFHMVFVASGSNTTIDWSSLEPACEAFLNVASTGATHPLAYYLSTEISRGASACELLAYDITAHLDGSPAGSPVQINNFTLGSAASGAINFPAGVAATLSWRADYGTDVEFAPGSRPRARDRNRCYLGPLNSAGHTDDPTTNRSKFTTGFINDCLHNLSALSQLNSGLLNQMDLQVWSRKNAGIKEAESAWMDDRPDYQRRRSDPSPGTRTYLDLAS